MKLKKIQYSTYNKPQTLQIEVCKVPNICLLDTSHTSICNVTVG